MRFAAVASAGEAMVWESETDGNPSVDADELPNEEVTEPLSQYAPEYARSVPFFRVT